MSSPASRWRAPIIGAVTGLAVAAAVVGQSALASGGNTHTPHAVAKAATASGTGSGCGAPAGSKDSSAGPAPTPFLSAVAQLVQAGTINQSQADILDAGIRAGSIDDQQLVSNGTLTSAQMQAVDARLIAIKRSLAPPPGCGGQPAGDEAKRPGGPSDGPGPAPFLAAVAQLVQAGTIDQHQADILDSGIRSGSIDDQQLVSNGTLSSAQMQAVDARLRAVKESLAPKAPGDQSVSADHKQAQQ
jgi:hypothetical protein